MKLKYFLIIILTILTSCDFTTAEENFNKANEYGDKKEYKNAISELDKSISKNPKYRRALFNRALFKTEIKDISGAVNDYKKILSFSNCTECGFQLAIIMKNDNQYKKAIEILNSTLKTKGVKKHNAFIKLNVQFFTDDSDSDYNVMEENIYFERGLVYLKSEQYKKAIDDFERIVDFGFYKSEAYFNIGKAYLGLKDTIKACENYKIAEKLKNGRATKILNEICK